MHTWEKIISACGIEHEKLRELCDAGLPVYDKSNNRIYATSQCSPCFPDIPRISWLKIQFNPKDESLDLESPIAEKFGEPFEDEEERQYTTKDRSVSIRVLKTDKKFIYDFSALQVVIAEETGDVIVFRKKIIPDLADDLLSTSLKNYRFSMVPSSVDFELLISSCETNYEREQGDRENHYPEGYLSPYSIKFGDLDKLPLYLKYTSYTFKRVGKKYEIFPKISIDYKVVKKLNNAISKKKIQLEITDHAVTFRKNGKYKKYRRGCALSSMVINNEIIRKLNDVFSYSNFSKNEFLIENRLTALLITIDGSSFYAPSLESVKFVLESNSGFSNIDYEQYKNGLRSLHLISCLHTYQAKTHRLPRGASSNVVFDFSELLSPISKKSPLYDVDRDHSKGFYFKINEVFDAIGYNREICKLLINEKFEIIKSKLNKKEQILLKILELKILESKTHIEIYELLAKNKNAESDSAKNVTTTRWLAKAKKLLPSEIGRLIPSGAGAWKIFMKNPDPLLRHLAEALAQTDVF